MRSAWANSNRCRRLREHVGNLSRRFVVNCARIRALGDHFLRGVASVGELFNVVHQAKQLPLPIDFRATTQREAIEPLVVPQIRKPVSYTHLTLPTSDLV